MRLGRGAAPVASQFSPFTVACKAQVGEDFLNHVGVFDGRYDLHLATARGAHTRVDIEDSFQKPCPTDSRSGMALGRFEFP